MFTTEMTILFPLILIILVSSLMLMALMVHDGVLEIDFNSKFYETLYGITVNSESSIDSTAINIKRNIHSRVFTSDKEIVEVTPFYSWEDEETFEKHIQYEHHNPRVYLFGKYGIERILNLE